MQRLRLAAAIAAVLPITLALDACGYLSAKPDKYSVFFQPYTSVLDDQARQTVQAAADYARDHGRARVVVAGHAAPPDPGQDIDGLSRDRAERVKRALIEDGVQADRIATEANGVIDPGTLPNLAARRVDITFGH